MIAFILVMLIIIYIDSKTLKRAKPKGRVIGLYAAIMGFTLVIGILLSVDRPPVSPADIIEAVIVKAGMGR